MAYATVISIHALLTESDFRTYGDVVQGIEFLSTLSLRRATCGRYISGLLWRFLSTLSLRRATDIGQNGIQGFFFLSTLSLRRATYGS